MFSTPVFIKLHPEPHLENISISEKNPLNLTKYQGYYHFESLEKDIYVLEEFYKDCTKFFSKNRKFHGKNKEGEECILGFKLCYYERGGAIYEPIIYNLNTIESIIDYKRMNLSQQGARNYQAMNYECENYYQFNFHANNLQSITKLEEMSTILKAGILQNSLNTNLPEKSENKVKVKI